MATLRHPSYHVVCHDCRHEWLTRNRDEAGSIADDHARTTDLSVEFARVE